MPKAWCCLGEVPYCFSRSSIKFQGHMAKKIIDFDQNLQFRTVTPQFEFTNSYEMMHKAWNSIEEVPYCLSRSSVIFQGHTGQKIIDFDPNCVFPDCNSSSNELMATKQMHKAWSSIEEVPCCFSMSSFKFQGHTRQKIAHFDPNWVFLDCNSSLNSLMALKWWKSLTWYKRGVLFFSRSSKISTILTRNECFRTITPVWIHPWLWNNAQSLM